MTYSPSCRAGGGSLSPRSLHKASATIGHLGCGGPLLRYRVERSSVEHARTETTDREPSQSDQWSRTSGVRGVRASNLVARDQPKGMKSVCSTVR